MVNIEIDGKPIQARDGAMVIEAADEAGIHIPRFCYHKKLSIAANCRMCLVEVEKAAKPLPACATPVTDGMKILTKSPKAIAAQKGVMEFLLINHPLDCPICDQGGECELQDVAMGYGGDVSRFAEEKRVVKDKNIGPLIATEMTRCIHCTRCVRFGKEIAGIKEMGATGRGEHMEIGTYVARSVDSELSGNMIDLCPVGALTSKPFRFSARAWEMARAPSVSPHDCLGSNIFVHTRRDEVLRVVPRENEKINEVWISDRDRFAYEGLNSADRLQVPMIKRNGSWQQTDWSTALDFAVNGIKKVVDKHGVEQLGALMSPSSTTEEFYLAQKLMRGIGSNNIDHRLRQLDFRDQDKTAVYPTLGTDLTALESMDAVLLVGSNIRKEQPVAGIRLRKAANNGAAIMAVNAIDYDFYFPVQDKIIVGPAAMAQELAGIVKALLDAGGKSQATGLDTLVAKIAVNDDHKRIAETLMKADKGAVVLGSQAAAHPELAILRALAGQIAAIAGCSIGSFTDGANSAGGWLAGALPHRAVAGQSVSGKAGLDARSMSEAKLKAYLLSGIEPESDCALPGAMAQSLLSADFIVLLSSYMTAQMQEYAHVILPIAPFTETSGTFVNVQGDWQSFRAVVNGLGESRPAWKVWRVFGNMFNLDGFDYVSSEEVLTELRTKTSDVKAGSMQWYKPESLGAKVEGVSRINEVPIYNVDPIVRRATALQQSSHTRDSVLYMNSSLAERFGLVGTDRAKVKQGDLELTLPVTIDTRVPDNCIFIPVGSKGRMVLGASQAPVVLEKM